jgi:hypothetical protein
MRRTDGSQVTGIMSKTKLAIGTALGISLFAAPLLLGCGDKFVVLGRGMRFQRALASSHPASILIYMNPASRVPAAEKEFQLQSTLKLAGHKPAVANDPGSLDRALKSGKYDLVLADLSDAATVEANAQASGSKPDVIPVVYNPTEMELSGAERRYSCLVKASKNGHDLLGVVDEAMSSRSKGTGATCQKTR